MRKWWLGLWLGVIFAAGCGFTVVGHRGDPLAAPEETIESFDHAFAVGADLVELDVHESADGVLIVQHDPDLLRMTGQPGAIGALTLAQIQTYHTKNGEPVHSLEDIFAHYQNTDRRFLIETKITKGEPHPLLEEKLAALVTQYHMTDRVMFHSFSLASLKRLHKLLPTVPRLFIVGSLKRINYALFEEVSGINVNAQFVTPELVRSLHAMDQKVYVWDEMNEDQAKWAWLANLNIDGVVTNYPATAASYQRAKAAAKVSPVDRALASNSSVQPLPIYPNPYTNTPTEKSVPAQGLITVTQRVVSAGETYYRIGNNAFVKGVSVNFARAAGWANQLLNTRGWMVAPIAPLTQQPTALTIPVYAFPTQDSAVVGTLLANQPVVIDAVRTRKEATWVHVQTGWAPADTVRIGVQDPPAQFAAPAVSSRVQGGLTISPTLPLTPIRP